MDQNPGAPTLTPPGAGETKGGGGVGTSKPTISDAAAAGAAEAAPQGPTGAPPGGAAMTNAMATTDGITGAWHNGVTVNAMWSADEIRNVWMSVVGVGWRKLYNGADGAFTALTILASQARQTGKAINYRDEADGMVHEIYLW